MHFSIVKILEGTDDAGRLVLIVLRDISINYTCKCTLSSNLHRIFSLSLYSPSMMLETFDLSLLWSITRFARASKLNRNRTSEVDRAEYLTVSLLAVLLGQVGKWSIQTQISLRFG